MPRADCLLSRVSLRSLLLSCCSRFWVGGDCRNEKEIQEVVHYSRFAEQRHGEKNALTLLFSKFNVDRETSSTERL